MYSWEKSLREDKPRRNPRKPSFSSTLLDEIMNSIDGDDRRSENFKAIKEKNRVGRAKTCSKEDEVVGIFKKENNEKIIARRRAEMEKFWLQENDFMFFSSNSSSSDSSGALSSSDSEFFGASNSTKSRISCFSAPKLKPIRTGERGENRLFCTKNEQFLHQNKQEKKVDDENLIKSKSRAMKIYSHFNKMKQPISPGARLTNLITSLFSNSKKTKKSNPTGGFEDPIIMERKSKSQQGSSRSCLINNSIKPVEKTGNVIRTVRFHPSSVILDEDDKKPVKKIQAFDRLGKPPLPHRRFQDSTRDYSSKVHPNRMNDDFPTFRNFCNKIEDEDEDEDEDDAASDSSSELFELDHLALFGNKKKFSEELPVYETTRFDANHAIIARSLMRK